MTQSETACNSVAKNPICPFGSGVLLHTNLADSCQRTLIIIMLGQMLIKLGQVS